MLERMAETCRLWWDGLFLRFRLIGPDYPGRIAEFINDLRSFGLYAREIDYSLHGEAEYVMSGVLDGHRQALACVLAQSEEGNPFSVSQPPANLPRYAWFHERQVLVGLDTFLDAQVGEELFAVIAHKRVNQNLTAGRCNIVQCSYKLSNEGGGPFGGTTQTKLTCTVAVESAEALDGLAWMLKRFQEQNDLQSDLWWVRLLPMPGEPGGAEGTSVVPDPGPAPRALVGSEGVPANAQSV